MDAADLTDDLAVFITQALSDEELDEIGVTRELDKDAKVASEAITIAVALTFATKVAVGGGIAVAAPKLFDSVVRLIGKYLDYRVELKKLEIQASQNASSEQKAQLEALAERRPKAVRVVYVASAP